jgi:Fic family protein
MNRASFTESRAGELVELTVPYHDWAFVPAPLPPDWELPRDLWPLLAEARQAVGTLDGIGRTLPNQDLLLRPLQQREALRSSSLEGTHATPQQLLLFEMDPRPPRSEHDRSNAWLEVSNYGHALREAHNYLLESPLSEAFTRALHEWLLKGVRGDDKSPGQYRECQVYIGSDRRFIPPPPTHLAACLEALAPYMRVSPPYAACSAAHRLHCWIRAPGGSSPCSGSQEY